MNNLLPAPCPLPCHTRQFTPRPVAAWLACLLAGLLYAAPALASTSAASAANTGNAKPAVKGSSIAYTVRAGDTLSGICAKFNITAANCQQVALFNTLENGKLPAAATVLYVPLDALQSRPEQVRLIQTTGLVKINGQPATAGARLSENTKIEAAADGSAVLEMADGSHVQVLPNSIADIVRSRNYSAPDSNTSGKIINWIGSKIRLVQGMLETKAKKNPKQPPGKPVEVETTTSMIGVRGTRFRVAAADKFVPFDRAEVLEGSVSNINTWKGSEIALAAGQGAVVNPNSAEMQAIPLLPAPAVPAKGQVLRRPDAYWQFSPVAGAVAYRVIAASDEAFQIISFSEKTTTPLADLSRLPHNGTWHLRARAVDSYGLEGLDATSSINLRQPAWVWYNPSIRSRNGQPIFVWTDITNARFEPLPGTSTLKLEFSRSNDFSSPVATLSNANTKEQALPQLGYGTYWLRASLANDSIKNDEQQIYVFDLKPALNHQGYFELLTPVRALP